LKPENSARVAVPEKSRAKIALDPHESLIPDARAGLSPSQMVDQKLWEVLHGGRPGTSD
jgi:hypothetical protein